MPLEIRRRLGLRKGDKIEFVAEERRTTVRRAVPKDNPFDKYIGALPGSAKCGIPGENCS